MPDNDTQEIKILDNPPDASKPIVAGNTNTTPQSIKSGATNRLTKPWAATEKLLPFLGIWENGVKKMEKTSQNRW